MVRNRVETIEVNRAVIVQLYPGDKKILGGSLTVVHEGRKEVSVKCPRWQERELSGWLCHF